MVIWEIASGNFGKKAKLNLDKTKDMLFYVFDKTFFCISFIQHTTRFDKQKTVHKKTHEKQTHELSCCLQEFTLINKRKLRKPPIQFTEQTLSRQ